MSIGEHYTILSAIFKRFFFFVLFSQNLLTLIIPALYNRKCTGPVQALRLHCLIRSSDILHPRPWSRAKRVEHRSAWDDNPLREVLFHQRMIGLQCRVCDECGACSGRMPARDLVQMCFNALSLATVPSRALRASRTDNATFFITAWNLKRIGKYVGSSAASCLCRFLNRQISFFLTALLCFLYAVC